MLKLSKMVGFKGMWVLIIS